MINIERNQSFKIQYSIIGINKIQISNLIQGNYDIFLKETSKY